MCYFAKKFNELILNFMYFFFLDLVACRTTGGGTTGALCVIPFIYKGKKYNGCTLQDDHQGKPWCSVRVDGDGKHIGGQGLWGHCNSKCKTDAST